MAKKTDKTVDIWKKKRWHKVLAPKLFNEKMIGETPALEPNMLIGRSLKINMMALTGDVKKQNVDVTFEIDRVMGDTAYSCIKKFNMNPSAIRRFVRRGRKRVDDSFVCLTSDNKKIRVKPFMVTYSKTTNPVITALRKRAREYIVRAAKSASYENFCRELITYNLQKSLKRHLSKTYPLTICDIRVLEIVGKDKKEAEGKPEVKEVTEPKEEKAEVKEEKKEAVKEGPEEEKEAKPEKPKEEKKTGKTEEEKAKKEEKLAEKARGKSSKK